MKSDFQKSDIRIFIGILILGIVFLLLYFFYPRSTGAQIIITKDNEVIGTYSLDDDQTLYISDEENPTNVVEILDGKCHMTFADCPDQICMKTGWVSKNGDTIVCLPNQVVVTVVSEESTEYDSISQ